jgi:hypothetical protein
MESYTPHYEPHYEIKFIEEYDKKGKPKKSSMFVDIITLCYGIDKHILEERLQNILIAECEVSVFGYNKCQDTYWCKKHLHAKVQLLIDIEIISNCSSSSNIIIVFQTGTQKQILNFMNKFTESLGAIQSSL